ncbi:MAG: protein translocase subunit SecF [Ktedonobacteraceae bacterium]
MFNLVGKRYLFLIISLLIIVPGTASLIFKGLNVGIDFAGGSSIDFRPEQTMTAQAIQNDLKSLPLKDVQVTLGSQKTVGAKQTIWVRLNTSIDTNVQKTITKDLQTKYKSTTLSVISEDWPIGPGGKLISIIIVTNFPTGVTPTISDIQTVLAKIPDTSDPSKGAPTTVATVPTTPATVTAGGTTTPTAHATPTARPTATSTAHATATVGKGTATPAATATTTTSSVNNPANIPVKVVEVHQGQTIQTIGLLTATTVTSDLLNKIKAAILAGSKTYVQTLDTSSVQGSVAADTQRNSLLAVLAASVLILLYVWFSFRKVSKPWRYGTCAIIALLHDVLVVVGVFSILGWTLGIQVDALFITALLTVVGFSVHDTIVVFDRIRENMQRRTSETFEQVVNASLVQTMARSLNTSLTVIVTLSALTLFGGLSIRQFTGALLLGIFSGTYSSIFNASMLLVIWEKGELGLSRFRRDERYPDGRSSSRKDRELARSRG